MAFENIILYIKDYGLNFVPSLPPTPQPNFYVEALTHNVMVFGDGAFGR